MATEEEIKMIVEIILITLWQSERRHSTGQRYAIWLPASKRIFFFAERDKRP